MGIYVLDLDEMINGLGISHLVGGGNGTMLDKGWFRGWITSWF